MKKIIKASLFLLSSISLVSIPLILGSCSSNDSNTSSNSQQPAPNNDSESNQKVTLTIGESDPKYRLLDNEANHKNLPSFYVFDSKTKDIVSNFFPNFVDTDYNPNNPNAKILKQVDMNWDKYFLSIPSWFHLLLGQGRWYQFDGESPMLSRENSSSWDKNIFINDLERTLEIFKKLLFERDKIWILFDINPEHWEKYKQYLDIEFSFKKEDLSNNWVFAKNSIRATAKLVSKNDNLILKNRLNDNEVSTEFQFCLDMTNKEQLNKDAPIYIDTSMINQSRENFFGFIAGKAWSDFGVFDTIYEWNGRKPDEKQFIPTNEEFFSFSDLDDWLWQYHYDFEHKGPVENDFFNVSNRTTGGYSYTNNAMVTLKINLDMMKNFIFGFDITKDSLNYKLGLCNDNIFKIENKISVIMDKLKIWIEYDGNYTGGRDGSYFNPRIINKDKKKRLDMSDVFNRYSKRDDILYITDKSSKFSEILYLGQYFKKEILYKGQKFDGYNINPKNNK